MTEGGSLGRRLAALRRSAGLTRNQFSRAGGSGRSLPDGRPRDGCGHAGHAFLSYVREDAHPIDQLQQALEAAGIPVWRDTASLWPGEDWRAKIRQAITDDALVFLACFSRTSLARRKSYQNEELLLAIDQLRQRRPGDPWLIPVRLDDCEIPDLDLGGGRTLTSIQRADLFGDYSEGLSKLIAAISRILGHNTDTVASPRPSAPVAPASTQEAGGRWHRARHFRIFVTVILVIGALVASGAYLWSNILGGQPGTTVTGSVVCESGQPVVGVWIAASTGQADSGFAHLGPPGVKGFSYPIGSSGTYSYRLPHGGTYAVHVGCGGTAHDWAVSDYSPLLSSRTAHLHCGAPRPTPGERSRGQCRDSSGTGLGPGSSR